MSIRAYVFWRRIDQLLDVAEAFHPTFAHLLWWCIDDHLAEALNMPGIGHLPIWVVLTGLWILGFATRASSRGCRS